MTEVIETVEASPGPTSAPEGRRRQFTKVWMGVLALAAIAGFLVLRDSPYLFTYNLAMLACFGAVSLNLLQGTAGLVSIGNPAFMMVGAFGSMFFLRAGIPFPVDIILASVLAAAAGVVIGLPALRLRGLHLALATMAGFFIILYLAGEYQTHAKGVGTGGFLISPLYVTKGITGGQVYWAWTLVVLVGLLMLLATRASQGRAGRAWRVIRDHETAAPALGIPVMRYKMIAFALTSGVIGFEGGLTAHFSGSVTVENFTFAVAIAYVAMVLIGGLDSVAGAVVGAGVVTALPVLVPKIVSNFMSADTAAQQGPALSTMAYGFLVILFITASHQGIVGLVRNIWNWGVGRVRR